MKGRENGSPVTGRRCERGTHGVHTTGQVWERKAGGAGFPKATSHGARASMLKHTREPPALPGAAGGDGTGTTGHPGDPGVLLRQRARTERLRRHVWRRRLLLHRPLCNVWPRFQPRPSPALPLRTPALGSRPQRRPASWPRGSGPPIFRAPKPAPSLAYTELTPL